jgi:CHAT domain-containing protein
LGRRPKKLIIMPDDVLCVLPFDALLMAADSTGIGLEKLPDTQIALDFRDIFPKAMLDSARALIMANSQSVKLNGETAMLPPLQNVVSEAKKIFGIFHPDSSDLLCDEQATGEAFRARAREYDLLHLAMHAKLSDFSPEYAQLYFGSVNGGSTQMYGYEISQLSSRARLAVLSACNTALGRYRPGFGLLSFVLNFVDAGVPSVVASLWQVDSKATEILMVEFYKQLGKGKSYSEALALAKQHLIKKEEYSDPYYWAGFVLCGKDGSIKFVEAPSTDLWVYAGFLIALGGLSLFWAKRRIKNVQNKKAATKN